MGNYDTIEISKEEFLPLLQWCLIKFTSDALSRQTVGGRSDKIGGFIDRFSNQCVNWIIFNHLLRNENFKVDPDYHFYNAKSAKNSADVIGLKGEDGNIVPLSYFDRNGWVHQDGAPFIEVKTVRHDQYCAGLGMPQYDDNHYYVYVESEFDELYLFNFIDDLPGTQGLNMDKKYVKNNSENILFNPPNLIPEKIATIRLLGTYKGSDLQEHNLKFPEGKKPRYIRSIERIKEEDINIAENSRLFTTINSERFIYEPYEKSKEVFLPIYTKSHSIDIIHREKKTDDPRLPLQMFIKVKDPCYLNQYELEVGFYKIKFKPFDRKSKETEIFNHKATFDSANHKYSSYPNNCTEELVERLKTYLLEN